MFDNKKDKKIEVPEKEFNWKDFDLDKFFTETDTAGEIIEGKENNGKKEDNG